MKFNENQTGSLGVVGRGCPLVPRCRWSRLSLAPPFPQPPYQPLAGLIGMRVYYFIALSGCFLRTAMGYASLLLVL